MSKLDTINRQTYPFIGKSYEDWKRDTEDLGVSLSFDLDIKILFEKTNKEGALEIVTGFLASYFKTANNFMEEALTDIPTSFATSAYNPAYILKDYILNQAGYASYDTMILQDAFNCIQKEIIIKELKGKD
jgi:hypothetical protein